MGPDWGQMDICKTGPRSNWVCPLATSMLHAAVSRGVCVCCTLLHKGSFSSLAMSEPHKPRNVHRCLLWFVDCPKTNTTPGRGITAGGGTSGRLCHSRNNLWKDVSFHQSISNLYCSLCKFTTSILLQWKMLSWDVIWSFIKKKNQPGGLGILGGKKWHLWPSCAKPDAVKSNVPRYEARYECVECIVELCPVQFQSDHRLQDFQPSIVRPIGQTPWFAVKGENGLQIAGHREFFVFFISKLVCDQNKIMFFFVVHDAEALKGMAECLLKHMTEEANSREVKSCSFLPNCKEIKRKVDLHQPTRVWQSSLRAVCSGMSNRSSNAEKGSLFPVTLRQICNGWKYC